MNKIFTYNGHAEHSIEFTMSYDGTYFIQQLNHICFDLIINTHCKWTVICYSWYLKSRAYKRPCSNVSFFSYVSLLLKLTLYVRFHATLDLDIWEKIQELQDQKLMLNILMCHYHVFYHLSTISWVIYKKGSF